MIKTINIKIEQNKAQYDLDRQTAKISALSSYEFLVGEGVSPEKGLLEKAAAIKEFEYSPLGGELKNQNDIAKKQYQGLDKVYTFDETVNKDDQKKQHLKSIVKQI